MPCFTVKEGRGDEGERKSALVLKNFAFQIQYVGCVALNEILPSELMS